MTVPANPSSGDTPYNENDVDAQRWREAKELRQDHRGWIVVWLAAEAEFRAYRRMHGARRDTALRAVTAEDMTTKIIEAEKPGRSSRQVTHG